MGILAVVQRVFLRQQLPGVIIAKLLVTGGLPCCSGAYILSKRALSVKAGLKIRFTNLTQPTNPRKQEVPSNAWSIEPLVAPFNRNSSKSSNKHVENLSQHLAISSLWTGGRQLSNLLKKKKTWKITLTKPETNTKPQKTSVRQGTVWDFLPYPPRRNSLGRCGSQCTPGSNDSAGSPSSWVFLPMKSSCWRFSKRLTWGFLGAIPSFQLWQCYKALLLALWV